MSPTTPDAGPELEPTAARSRTLTFVCLRETTEREHRAALGPSAVTRLVASDRAVCKITQQVQSVAISRRRAEKFLRNAEVVAR